jgi:hypothetical protein
MCIDQSGLMKACPQPDGGGGTELIPSGGTPILGYNTSVNVNGNTITWTTSSTNGPWLDFPGNRTYIIDLPAPLAGHPFAPAVPFLSADNPSDPSSPHANYISGASYLAEETNDAAYTQITVFNASCAHYSLLLEVTADISPDASSADASVATDASDSSTDGPAAAAVSDSSADAPNATDSEPAE